nr:hypothetical protein [uncultured Desulfuromonas sp.]
MWDVYILGGVLLVGLGWLNYRQIRHDSKRLEHELKKALIRRV